MIKEEKNTHFVAETKQLSNIHLKRNTRYVRLVVYVVSS